MEKGGEKQENVLKGKPSSSLSVAVFNKDNQIIFFYKKTEKISAALYLVTNLFPTNEPLKTSIRQIALRLLQECAGLSGRRETRVEPFQTIAASFLEVLSYLEVGQLSGLISEMNVSIIRSEIDHLLEIIDAKQRPDQNKGLMVGREFFAVSEDGFVAEKNEPAPGIHSFIELRRRLGEREKRQGASLKDMQVAEPGPLVSKPAPKEPTPLSPRPLAGVSDKKNTRREQILDILKTRTNLSIKDFSGVIKGCSEKTIQRELLALVAEGVLKKEGERRWSTYSMA